MSPFVMHLSAGSDFEIDRIQPYSTNPRYWQYKGQPIMLFGGTHDDDPFNSPTNDPMGNPTEDPLGTEHHDQHMDLLISAGGNYIRNGMTHRDMFSVYAFAEGTPHFTDDMTSTAPWTATSASMAVNTTWTLDQTASVTLWGAAATMVLSRSIPAVNVTGGRVYIPFWTADTTTASRVSSVRVRLKTGANFAEVTYTGSMVAGWHKLIFHESQFSGSGFDPTDVDGIELRVITSNTIAQDAMGFDTVTIRNQFDLTQWNQAYWDRFDALLAAAHARDIIVQVELWDKVDMFWEGDSALRRWSARGSWKNHPFNPRNNMNYTAATSGLKEVIDYSYNPAVSSENGDAGIATIHPFFWTPPSCAELLPGGPRELANLELTADQHNKLVDVVLPLQEAFVSKVMTHALNYPNVLYSVSNESETPSYDWMQHWSTHARWRATMVGKSIVIGEMRGEYDPSLAPAHAQPFIIENPNLFDFIDISQNTAGTRTTDERYDEAIWVRDQLGIHGVRPMTAVKMYGYSDQPSRYWTHYFAGLASTRYHRRMAGALNRDFDSDGLPNSQSNVLALTTFEASRMLATEFDLWLSEPANNLLSNRSANEAYALAIAGEKYAVYFPAGGSVNLAVPLGDYNVRWLSIPTSTWSAPVHHANVTSVTLTPSTSPHDIALVEAGEPVDPPPQSGVHTHATLTGGTTTATTSQVIPLPDHQVGDILLLGIRLGSNTSDIGIDPGWNWVTGTFVSGNWTMVSHRVADGSEGGTVTVTSPEATKAAWAIKSIRGAAVNEADYIVGANATGSINPPNVTAPWGADDNLAVTYLSGRTNDWAASPPSGYGDVEMGQTEAGAGTDLCRMYSARRDVTTASEDPAAWTVTSGSLTAGHAQTVLVRPAP